MDQLKKIDLLMLMIFVDTHKPALPVMKLFFGEKNLAISTFRDIMQENHPVSKQACIFMASKLLNYIMI